MSLLGKILALLCVVAAFAFVALAASDLKQRQEWSNAVFRHDLGIDGLPIDDNQRDSEGHKLVDHLSDFTMKDLSQQAGGEPPLEKTQQKELEKLKSKLDAELANLKEEDKNKRLMEILKPLKRSSDERNAVDVMKLPALEADYTHRFEEATSPLYDAAKDLPRREPEEKRRAIAHVLFNHTYDEAWHKRVVTIVGLKAYAEEADRQADAYAAMVPPLELAMLNDRRYFVTDHERILTQLRVLAEDLENRQALLVQQKQLNKDHDDQVKNRQTTLENLQKQLEVFRTKLKDVLAEQARFEKALFDAQRRTRDTSLHNQEAERKIRLLEQEKR